MIQVESFAMVSEELLPLLKEHWEEVALHKDAVKLDPIWEQYFQMEREQRLITVTARQDGNLVGYCIWFLRNHAHYAQCMVASNDVIFVRKSARKGTGFGTALISESEKLLASLALRAKKQLRICWHIKPDHDWSAILKRKNYQTEEIILGKLINVT